jgi:hypothetical protein
MLLESGDRGAADALLNVAARSYRDERDTAIEAEVRNLSSTILVTDLCDGYATPKWLRIACQP